ncbi:MAG: ribulose-phosphate 3-epimerase [Planctomycetota bacterium]|nr:MAG: ribulose-phosphate 3-epimerase [Planctomycetota bacterium]
MVQAEADSGLNQLFEVAPQITVGLLTADLLNLGAEVRSMEEAGVQVVHFDVMDGSFCPMTTMGPPWIQAVKTKMMKDVHLMVEEPLDKLEDYVKAGADMITVHAESTRHLHRVMQRLGEMENVNHPGRGIVRGVALTPSTPLEVLDPVWEELDLVNLLAVNPGFPGQSFLSHTRDRIHEVHQMIFAGGDPILVCVDGGVHKDNIGDIAALGVDLIVTGSAVFDGKNPAENARFMQEQVRTSAPVRNHY